MIPEAPILTVKRASNLQGHLMKSHFTRPTRHLGTGQKMKGLYPCGECNICQFMTPMTIFTHPKTGTTYTLYNYVNCKSKYVIYWMIGPCSRIYIGQISQELHKRIHKHLSSITLADRDTSQGKKLTAVSENYYKHHWGNTWGLKVLGFEIIFLWIQGGDITKMLLRKESHWIFQLGALAPQGLN